MTRKVWTAGLLCIALLLAVVMPERAAAQVLYGSIVGNVKDASEAAVSGATITITNTSTNQSRQTTSNDVGGYRLPTVEEIGRASCRERVYDLV